MNIFNNKDKEAIIVNSIFNKLMNEMIDDKLIADENIESYRKIFDEGFSACITLAVYKSKNN